AAFFERLRQHPLCWLGQRRAAGRQERFERAVGQRAQMTPPRQAIAYLVPTARTGDRSPKISVTKGDVVAHKTEVLADRAHGLWLRLQGRLSEPRLQPR